MYLRINTSLHVINIGYFGFALLLAHSLSPPPGIWQVAEECNKISLSLPLASKPRGVNAFGKLNFFLLVGAGTDIPTHACATFKLKGEPLSWDLCSSNADGSAWR